MEQKRDLAIILRSVPYDERHRVVTALTENHGKISALARNAIQSRRFGGTLELFAASEWRFTERIGASLYRLEGAEIRRGFEGLRKDFEQLALASVLNELMLRLPPEREPCPELFRLHSNALAHLDEATPQSSNTDLAFLNCYLAKIIQWSGNQPTLKWCLGCKTSLDSLEPHEAIACMIADAGWVCQNCRSQETQHIRKREGQSFKHYSLRVTPAALQDFQTSLNTPIRQISEAMIASQQEHRALFAFLEALFVYHVPGFDRTALKGLRFLGLESSLQSHEVNPRQNHTHRP
jgi:DNA repair protein RecO